MRWKLCTAIPVFLCLALATAHADTPQERPTATPADDSLRIGIFPRRRQTLTLRLFTPLARFLEAELQRKVVLESAPDFASFWPRIADYRFDLVHFNQYHYLRSHRDYGYQVILRNEEFGESTIAGVLLARRDSGIETLADLRGRKIVFGGGRMAMISYIVPTYLLRKAGLREGDYSYQFALTPPKAAIAVYYHQAAVAGTGHRILNLPIIKKELDVDDLHIIAQSEPLAHLPWAISPHMDPALGRRIRALMISLRDSDAGRAILTAARVTAFVPTQDADYDPHRRIVREVLNEQY
ncbi:MAG TPA: phosphate/phosphite/phosphonate ABC transporter substrate-binding protein [Gammaproteobacteria bacterium]|nr:phosphate/phosphite/phosphonate ABC transporter substrate-binding protein [Gammaproteobacteria bacterium]